MITALYSAHYECRLILMLQNYPPDLVYRKLVVLHILALFFLTVVYGFRSVCAKICHETTRKDTVFSSIGIIKKGENARIFRV